MITFLCLFSGGVVNAALLDCDMERYVEIGERYLNSIQKGTCVTKFSSPDQPHSRLLLNPPTNYSSSALLFYPPAYTHA